MEETAKALNTILNGFQKRCKCLENITADGSLMMGKIAEAQEMYIKVSELLTNLNRWVREYEDLLPNDEEEEII